jgi:hypothetical protein
VLTPLAAWAGFYVIVGSAAAGLTGLQFVVMALIADGRRRSSLSQIDAFGTPTIVHFCVTLLVSAILSAPWQRLVSVAVALGACGVFGVVYALVVLRRARRQTGYAPVLEDWIWYFALPFIAYAALLTAAVALALHPTSALFMIAAATFLLLFTGIHNAWDTVTYIAVEWLQAPDDSDNKSQ